LQALGRSVVEAIWVIVAVHRFANRSTTAS
jgi:hypothetical protein